MIIKLYVRGGVSPERPIMYILSSKLLCKLAQFQGGFEVKIMVYLRDGLSPARSIMCLMSLNI